MPNSAITIATRITGFDTLHTGLVTVALDSVTGPLAAATAGATPRTFELAGVPAALVEVGPLLATCVGTPGTVRV